MKIDRGRPVLVLYVGRTSGRGKGKLRWRVVANGKKISGSSEGYVHENDRRRSVELTLAACELWLMGNP
jgi:hypothetical protein